MVKTCTPLLVALVVLVSLPSQAFAGGDRHDGKAQRTGGVTRLGITDDPRRIALAASALAGTSEVVRIPVSWADIPQSGWAEIDLATNVARASGQQMMYTVYGLQAPDLGQWAAFLRALHFRYPDLWAVQAWNEPNLASIGGGLTVEQSAAIVRTAREALPGVRLVGPGVSPSVPGAGRYQARLYRALPDSIGVGLNVYTYDRVAGVADVVAAYRKAKAEGGRAEVYVTELGFHGAYFPNQAVVSARAFKALRDERAAAVFFYRALADRSTTLTWELTGDFHVLNDDLSPTPILTALQRVSR